MLEVGAVLKTGVGKLLSSVGGWTKEKSSEFLQKTRSNINLSQMMEDRNVRDMALRTAKDKQVSVSKHDAAAFVKVFREIQTLMGSEGSCQFASPRSVSSSLRIGSSNEIRVRQLESATPVSSAVWEVVLDNHADKAPNRSARIPQEMPLRIKIAPEATSFAGQMKVLGEERYDALVYSPAGLAHHINAWMMNAYKAQREHGKIDEATYKQKTSAAISSTALMNAFDSPLEKYWHKASRGLSEISPVSTTIEDWSHAGLITEARPEVFDEICRRYTAGSDKAKQKFEEHITRGLSEIASYPQGVLQNMLTSNPNNAILFEQNLEIIARYLQPRDIEHHASLEERFGIEPVAVDALVLSHIQAVSSVSETLTKALGNKQAEHGNFYRVFAQVDDSMDLAAQNLIAYNNMEWAKNEVISTLTERHSSDHAVSNNILADVLKSTDTSSITVESSDTPQIYCQKVITKALDNIDEAFQAERGALQQLQQDLSDRALEYSPV